MNKRRYQSLSRLSLALLVGLLSVSLGATGKDDARALSLTALAASSEAIDSPGHHFGFLQASVAAQSSSQLTLLAAPSPVINLNGPPCTTIQGQTCTITGQVNGIWVKTSATNTPAPNNFTFNAVVPDGATLPQGPPPIFIPTTRGMEAHSCTAPAAAGSSVTCTGSTASDIVQNRPFTVRFAGSAGLIDVTNSSTIGYTGGGSCPNVPPVTVRTVDDGHSRLAVTVASNTAAGVSSNGIYALGFDAPQATDNRQVDIGSLIGQTGSFTASITPAQPEITFFVRPQVSGQPATVGFTAYHACGSWHSIAGTGHFTPLLSSAPPSADVVAATANNKVLVDGQASAVAPAVEQPLSTAPSAPVLNTAPVSAPPAAVAPPAVSAPPVVSAPPAVSVPVAPFPAAGSQSVVPSTAAQPRVNAPFAQPQPLLPFGLPAGYPLVAPVAPFAPPAAVEPPVPAPNPFLLPNSSAPVAAPPAHAPNAPAAADPASVSPPPATTDSSVMPPFATADSVMPPAAAPPAVVVPPADSPAIAPDPASSNGGAAPEESDSIEPPFAQ